VDPLRRLFYFEVRDGDHEYLRPAYKTLPGLSSPSNSPTFSTLLLSHADYHQLEVLLLPMDHSKATTPPATPSRASIDPTTSAESSTVSMHPPRMDNSDDFIEITHVPDLVDVTPSQ